MRHADSLLIVLILAFSLPIAVSAADRAVLPFDSAELPAVARGLTVGDELRLEGLRLDAGPPAALELERFRVFTRDARILVHRADSDLTLPAPDNAYFRGFVEGRARSAAFLTVRATGGMRGIIADAGRYWVLAGGTAAGGPELGLALREIDAASELAARVPAWSCSAGQLYDPTELLDAAFSGGASPAGGAEAPTASYTARVGIETDVEFFNLFGNAADATDYVGDVIAYGSGIYDTEVDTTLEIEVLSLWTGGSDPWNETSTICGLFEFGRYWNDNNPGIDRTIAHFFSGKNNDGGVAWLGVLCSGEFNVDISGNGCGTLGPPVDNYGGGYGYSGDLDGNFDINNPMVLWDMVVVAHEIGHNFNSPHTHCYAGLGGNSNQVDECVSLECGSGVCHCGATSLPAGCPGQAQGCGTLMSYCHLRAGGMGNLSLTFGLGWPYGIAPGRVPTRMNAHVVQRAASNPGCLDLVEPEVVFADGFESGDTSAWSAAVP